MKTSRERLNILRQLMALLTVIAALVFQLRIDALGQLGPAQTSPANHAEHQMPATESIHSGHTTHTTGHQHHQARQPQPTPRPTRQPEPSPHQHSAHCPFCLTNAFGLEAGITGLPQGPPDFLPAPEAQILPVYLAVISSVDARAPPVL